MNLTDSDSGKFPTGASVEAACWICERRVKSKELNDPIPVFVRRSILVLFPFLNCGIGDSKSQSCSQLRHGKVEVNALFTKMLAKGFWIGGIVS